MSTAKSNSSFDWALVDTAAVPIGIASGITCGDTITTLAQSILKLRARVEALEAAQRKQQPEPIDEEENDRRFHACMDLIHNATPEQIRAAAGLPAPAALSDALIKAECALADIAEVAPVPGEPDPMKWAERRCAEALAIIRPVMQQHKIRTSEWPPAPQLNHPEKPDSSNPADGLVERMERVLGGYCAGSARAAIREVAAWLRSGDAGAGHAWELVAVLLEQEANR